MIIKKTLGVAAVLFATSVLLPASAGAEMQNMAKPMDGLEFTVIPKTPIEIAVLWGDPSSGPSAVMLKFPPKFPGGMHRHTHGYHGIVIKGGSKHWVQGVSEENAPLQNVGDYWYQLGGQVHQDSFPTDEETILYLQFDGPMDTFFAN